MLKLRIVEDFPAEVEVRLPDGSTGTFTARFRYISKERYAELIDQAQALAADGDTRISDLLNWKARVIEELLTSVEGIADADGKPLDQDSARRAVLEHLPLLNAAFDAFVSCYGGAAAKNSKTSRSR